MTEVDVQAEIEIERKFTSFVARIPLIGHVTQDWIERYEALASREGISVHAEDRYDRSWITVFATTTRFSRAHLLKCMDMARTLIAEADTMDPLPSTSPLEGFAHEWWQTQRARQTA